MSERKESSGGPGIGEVALWASGCLACCSDVRVGVCSHASVAACGGTAVEISCAGGEGLCSRAGVGVVWLVQGCALESAWPFAVELA